MNIWHAKVFCGHLNQAEEWPHHLDSNSKIPSTTYPLLCTSKARFQLPVNWVPAVAPLSVFLVLLFPCFSLFSPHEQASVHSSLTYAPWSVKEKCYIISHRLPPSPASCLHHLVPVFYLLAPAFIVCTLSPSSSPVSDIVLHSFLFHSLCPILGFSTCSNFYLFAWPV